MWLFAQFSLPSYVRDQIFCDRINHSLPAEHTSTNLLRHVILNASSKAYEESNSLSLRLMTNSVLENANLGNKRIEILLFPHKQYTIGVIFIWYPLYHKLILFHSIYVIFLPKLFTQLHFRKTFNVIKPLFILYCDNKRIVFISMLFLSVINSNILLFWQLCIL